MKLSKYWRGGAMTEKTLWRIYQGHCLTKAIPNMFSLPDLVGGRQKPLGKSSPTISWPCDMQGFKGDNQQLELYPEASWKPVQLTLMLHECTMLCVLLHSGLAEIFKCISRGAPWRKHCSSPVRRWLHDFIVLMYFFFDSCESPRVTESWDPYKCNK